MLFNGLEFWLFLPLVLLVHYAAIPANAERARKGSLVAASYVFYMAWNPPFALLLLASTLLDFWLGLRIERHTEPRVRRGLLVLSLLGNLGMLGFFKYGDFVLESVYDGVGLFTATSAPPLMNVVLPVGISFYTFQSLSYSIDVYRRQIPATRSLLDFSLYVSFFPQLVAGPIVRAAEFLPQLAGRRAPAPRDLEAAAIRIATGLVKKVVFADVLGAYVDAVYASPEAYGGINAALAIYAYAFQVYFDFSGYCDIAVGLGLLFGIRLPENFDRPYLAASPREFWQRWHISLSEWLRDYVYVSLGGNRGGAAFIARNLMITMLLGGLWHGAAWHFVAWGAYHGVWLVFHRYWIYLRGGEPARSPRWLRQVATFHGLCLGLIIFRAPSLADAWTLLSRLPAPGFDNWAVATQAALALAIGAALHVTSPPRWGERLQGLPAWAQGVACGACVWLVVLFSEATERFIYFQF